MSAQLCCSEIDDAIVACFHIHQAAMQLAWHTRGHAFVIAAIEYSSVTVSDKSTLASLHMCNCLISNNLSVYCMHDTWILSLHHMSKLVMQKPTQMTKTKAPATSLAWTSFLKSARVCWKHHIQVDGWQCWASMLPFLHAQCILVISMYDWSRSQHSQTMVSCNNSQPTSLHLHPWICKAQNHPGALNPVAYPTAELYSIPNFTDMHDQLEKR